MSTRVSDSVQLTFVSKDEKQWKLEQKAKWGDAHRRKHDRQSPPPLPDGPCCGRCGRWHEPEERGDFGECGFLNVTTERIPDGPDKGTVMSFKEANEAGATYVLVPLRTKAFATCSAFDEIAA